MTEKNLKPCPYCGGKAYIAFNIDRVYINAYHKRKCLIKPDTWLISDEGIKKQIKAWNMRDFWSQGGSKNDKNNV